MRTTLAFLAMGAGLLASTACAPTVSTSSGAFDAQSSPLSSDAIPKPSSTTLEPPSFGPKPRGWLHAGSAPQSLIYVADGNQVEIFPERGFNPASIGAITDQIDSAYGLFVDGKRDLFVANHATITAYHPGSVHPWIVYSDAARPMFVVTDHAGRLYAANHNGTVTEYPPRQTTPDRTLRTPGVEADGIGLDAATNLYVAYRYATGSGSIEKFPPNSRHGRILGMQLIAPQGLQLDHSGNILVAETENKHVVDIFPPGSQSPSQIVQADYGVTQIALRESEGDLYVSDYVPSYAEVYMSGYPPGEFHQKINAGLTGVQGMALSNQER